MKHAFDTEIAKKVGIIPAIIYDFVLYWCLYNQENGINERDGRFWTYHSISDLCEIFPYLTFKQIRRGLDILVKEGLVVTGNFNKLNFDRTRWFTVDLPSRANDLPHRANDESERANDLPHRANQYQLITTTKSIQLNSNKESKPKKEPRRFVKPTLEEVQSYCLERGNQVDPQKFIDYYESNGWKVGRNKMVDWKATVRTWERNDSKKKPPKKTASERLKEMIREEEGNDTATDSETDFFTLFGIPEHKDREP